MAWFKMILLKMPWLKWTFGEAGFRTVSMALQKQIGQKTEGLNKMQEGMPLMVISTFIIGIVQSIGAITILTKKGIPPLTGGAKLITGSVFFGIGAFVNTMIAFMAYVYNANMPVYTMLTLLAIVPIAFVDRAFFGERIEMRHAIGILCAVFAGWLILNKPDLDELHELPIWAFLGLCNALGLAVNQGITRWIKDVDPWVKNFWGGMTTWILCLISLPMILSGLNLGQLLSLPAFQDVALWSFVIAFAVIGIWTYNVFAYRDGSPAAIKHVVVNGVFLTLTIAFGYMLFDDKVTPIQVGGIFAYLLAFYMMSNEIWEEKRKKAKKQISQHI